MTWRDLGWRTSGALLYAGGCGGALLNEQGSTWVMIEFLGVIVGMVLMLNGKRVAVALRAELRGHPRTADAVHAARLQRRR